MELTLFGFELEQLKQKGNKFTAAEIFQQPKLWEETINIIENRKTEIQAFLQDKLIDKKARVIFTGAGTSAYVGDTAAPYVSRLIPNRVESIATTDLVSSPLDYLNPDVPTVLVSFARSGNSPESVGAFDLAQQLVKEIWHIVITCNPDGELAKKAEACENGLVLYMPEASNDQGFAMTSSFSCMYITALLIFDLDNLDASKAKLRPVIEQAKGILNEQYPSVQELVRLGKGRVVYLGSSVLKGLAKETALKNLELTSGIIPTLSESVLGFRHGPKSIVNDDTLVFVFLSNDPYTRKYERDLLKELKGDEGRHVVVAVTYGKDEALTGESDRVLTVAEDGDFDLPDSFIALDYLLYGQLYAMFSSMKLGIHPDNPRPDGTVNRVVKGVTLYPFEHRSKSR